MHAERRIPGYGQLEAARPRLTPRRPRRRGCGRHLRLAIALELTSPGACQSQPPDVRVAKGFYNRGYGFVRVSVLTERGEEAPAWAPSYRMVKKGECVDIGYLPIADVGMCKAAFEVLRPEQQLDRRDVWTTTDRNSPYGCFLLEQEEDGGRGMGQLWIGASTAYGDGRPRRQWTQDSHRHAICRSQAYQASFFHRWTSKTLRSEVLQVGEEGGSVSIGGQRLELKLPRQGRGVAGVLLSDPCFSSRGGVPCPNGRHMHVLDRLTEVLNEMLASDELHFWAVLGNSFFDQNGTLSGQFFGRLSTSAKLKPLFTVPGNHDFWIGGAPPGFRNDSLGYGFMQFYGQDSAAATASLPYRFGGAPASLQLAKAENFVIAAQMGDLALFGYSGAHSWRTTEPHATRFCRFVGETASVNAVVVLGHWAVEETGCSPGMDVPSVHARVRRMAGCSGKRVLYFAGHTHCNRVDEENVGFLVGGAGMRSPGCSQLGVTVLQTDPEGELGPDVRVDYFPIREESSELGTSSLVIEDYYYELIRCLRKHGYVGCRDRHSRPLRRKASSGTSTTPNSTSGGSSRSTASPAAANSSYGHLLAAGAPGAGKRHGEAGPDWRQVVYRTPAPVDEFVSAGGRAGASGRGAPARGGPSASQSMALRVMGVTAAALAVVALAVGAWFWVSWRRGTRNAEQGSNSRRLIRTSPNLPGGENGTSYAMAGASEEHRYLPVAASEPDTSAPASARSRRSVNDPNSSRSSRFSPSVEENRLVTAGGGPQRGTTPNVEGKQTSAASSPGPGEVFFGSNSPRPYSPKSSPSDTSPQRQDRRVSPQDPVSPRVNGRPRQPDL